MKAIKVESEEGRAMEIASALMETLERMDADPANGMLGLIMAWSSAGRALIQEAPEEEQREANKGMMLRMLRMTTEAIAGVDTGDKGHEEAVKKMMERMEMPSFELPATAKVH